MAKVSTKIFTAALERFPHFGLTTEQLCAGIDVTPEQLANPDNELDWPLAFDLIERIRELLGSDEAFFDFTADALRHAKRATINRLFRVAAGPEHLYRVFSWTQRFFAHGFRSTVSVEADGRLRVICALDADEQWRDIAHLTNLAMLRALPVALDLPPARVEAVPNDDPQQRTYLVQPPPPANIWRRLGRAWATIKGRDEVLEVLADQQQLLLAQYAELEAAHRANVEQLALIEAEATRREEAERRLRQAQRLEVIGQLAGGISHDFNNLLTAIMANLDMLRADLPDGSEPERCAADALKAAEAGAELTQSLLAFSRHQALQPTVLDVNGVVAESARLLRRTVPENIELVAIPSAEPALCEVDAAQLQNAILNLGVNAQHALQPDGGVIGIEVGEGLPQANGERLITLTVTDDGVGMAAEVLERVFEPFFTTREVGAGSGMGLSMVYGFVHQSGGDVSIDSQPGGGTQVTISLPRVVGRAAEVVAPGLDCPRGNGELILVVEDHPQVRRAADWLLTRLGYRTRLAKDGAQALDQIDDEIDLLFTDVVMPGTLTGVELAERARQRRPDLPVLLTTGHTPEQAGTGNGRVLPKPYTADSLARAVRGELARG